VNVIVLPILATAFSDSIFNGDLSQWDVSKVTTMYLSKSMCIFENGCNGME
jgi:hypothetical protein